MCPGGSNFFQNPDSSVWLNSGPWAKVGGLHPAQILRSQHLIALKILPVNVKLMFSTKNRFFRFGSFSGHARAWEINISATCCGLECVCRLQKKKNTLTNRIFIEMQKTTVANVKLTFFVAATLFVLKQIL